MPGQRERIEFGDFQTPDCLARQVCALIARKISPQAILEPTCGTGNFLRAALEEFPKAVGVGLDINSDHVRRCNDGLRAAGMGSRGNAIVGDFFCADWSQLTQSLDDPLLLIGNPPWVTNAGLGILGSSNLPEKSNFQLRDGFAAKTGKSNFDISESMLIRLIEAVAHRPGTVLAFLCKTGVARRLFHHVSKTQLPVGDVEIRRIDAKAHFDVAVDACLVCAVITESDTTDHCAVFDGLDDSQPTTTAGVRNCELVSDAKAYDRLAHLDGRSPYIWRSGVKHDCSRVMEVTLDLKGYRNGLGHTYELEDTLLFPLLKSSELRPARVLSSNRRMIVTQERIGDDTSSISQRAPLTWEYLNAHAELLDSRRSSIYRNRPRFSMFGIGPYTFSPWKVAISGLYKRLSFVVVGPMAV